MPKLKIDNREVEVPPGATLLDAARKLGIDIPAMCYREGCEASTSCLVCMVKIGHNHRLVPSCATAATEGLEVESETDDVHQVRRSALELLLSDHLGDCLAPCWYGCPAQMNIPQMLRQIAAGDLRGAIATVKADIALPAVLGRICPAPCEKVCRRTGLDGAVSICLLKRYVADVDLASGDPYLPLCRPATGKRVAIVGAGPAGLAAAYYLAQAGHTSTVFDEHESPGGRLRQESPERLPPDVLDAEIAQIARLAVELRCSVRVGREVAWSDLKDYDAVLVAAGATAREQAEAWGLTAGPHGIQINRKTFATSVPGVFAAGLAVRGKGLAVRSVADGKEAAIAIDQFLSGQPVTGPAEPFSTKIGRMEQSELLQMSAGACQLPSPSGRGAGGEGTSSGIADNSSRLAPRDASPLAERAVYGGADRPSTDAQRCLHCDCRGLTNCKLRKYAAQYKADPRRFKAERRPFQQDSQHADVVYEPGKCIDCGLCIQIAADAGEELGLTFIGRGFNVRVGVPYGHSIAEALQKVAAECVEACPTAALAWRDSRPP